MPGMCFFACSCRSYGSYPMLDTIGRHSLRCRHIRPSHIAAVALDRFSTAVPRRGTCVWDDGAMLVIDVGTAVLHELQAGCVPKKAVFSDHAC